MKSKKYCFSEQITVLNQIINRKKKSTYTRKEYKLLVAWDQKYTNNQNMQTDRRTMLSAKFTYYPMLLFYHEPVP